MSLYKICWQLPLDQVPHPLHRPYLNIQYIVERGFITLAYTSQIYDICLDVFELSMMCLFKFFGCKLHFLGYVDYNNGMVNKRFLEDNSIHNSRTLCTSGSVLKCDPAIKFLSSYLHFRCFSTLVSKQLGVINKCRINETLT